MVKRFAINYKFAAQIINSQVKVNILDVGGYTGDNLYFWKKRKINTKNIEYHIADYDIKAANIAERRGAITHYYDLNIDNLAKIFKNKKFDLIICTEVLEHLIDPQKQLEYFKKLLKKNGRIIISLPNENTVFHRIYSLVGLGIDQYPFTLYKHLHFPTIKQSSEFMKKNFDIIDHKYYMNFGGNGSRFSFFGKIFTLIPDVIWETIVNILPGLFARGTVFYLKLIDDNNSQ